MESEWRYNIAKWHMAAGDWLLCSRLLDFGDDHYLVHLNPDTLGTDEAGIFYNNPDFSALPVLIASFGIPPGLHFPYGLRVEAD